MTVIRVSKPPPEQAQNGPPPHRIPPQDERPAAGPHVAANGHAAQGLTAGTPVPPIADVLATFRAYIKSGVFAGTGNFHITLIIPFEDVQAALPLMEKPGTTFVWTAGMKARSKVYEDPWVTEDEGEGEPT